MANSITQRQRSWLKDNFIGLILLAMVGAYFSYDMIDKQQNRTDHRKYEQDISDLENITYNLVQTYNGKSQIDADQNEELKKQRDEILELWKCTKRSGTSKDLTLKQ